jgi:hypothetical protein
MIQHDLSFHFDQPEFAFADLDFAFQVFTVENVYGFDASKTRVVETQQGLQVECEGFTWAGGQERASGRASVDLKFDADRIQLSVTAEHTQPIKAAKVLIYGLVPGSVTHLGQFYSGEKETAGIEVPAGADHLIVVPGWTPDGLVFLHHQDRCTAFASQDIESRPKRFYFSNRRGRFVVELIFEEAAEHWTTRIEVPPWWISTNTTTSEAIDSYAAWLEEVDDLKPWQERSDVPDWAREVKLIVNFHGEHWTGYVFNTFDEMLDILQTLQQWIPAKHVLAYLPGFSGRYYENYPNYQPGPRMGGLAGFHNLVEGARSMGCRLMPMFGAHGCNLARFPQWRQAVVRDRYDQAMSRLNLPDWDGDRAGDEMQVFLNLGNREYRDHLIRSIGSLVDRFQLEAVFLDTISWLPNDACHSMWKGVENLMTELRQRFPDVLWASEGAHARMMRYFPLVQFYLKPAEGVLYPEFAYRYIRTFDHLVTGAPGLGSSGVHEWGFHGFQLPELRPYHLSALSIVGDTLEKHAHVVRKICEMALARV